MITYKCLRPLNEGELLYLHNIVKPAVLAPSIHGENYLVVLRHDRRQDSGVDPPDVVLAEDGVIDLQMARPRSSVPSVRLRVCGWRTRQRAAVEEV